MEKRSDIKKIPGDKKDWCMAVSMFIFFFIFYALLFWYFKKTNFLSSLKRYDYLIFGFIAAGTTIILPVLSLLIRKILEKELNR